MPRILITGSFHTDFLVRQSPNGDGRWEEFEFLFAPTDQPVDGWVVYDNLQGAQQQLCPPENTLLITGEPASVRRYHSRFTGQFAQLWTAQDDLKHRQVSYRNEAQPWLYALYASHAHGGTLNFKQLAALACPPKPKRLSVICSDKQVTPDQRQRLLFTQFLKSQLGDELDVFGRGCNAMNDKADAIWPYTYHIVLENDHADYFMTEKITDAYLGWSYPIYFGGKEAYHRFPEGSFTAIDIYQPRQALAIIRDLLNAPSYENALPQLATARDAVLNKHNLLAGLASYWREHLVASRPRVTKLLPKSHRARLVAQQLSRTFRRAA